MSEDGFYTAVRQPRDYAAGITSEWLTQVSMERVSAIAGSMEQYISANLPRAVLRKSQLSDYRASPYVLMATAGALNLADPRELARYLVDLKLYMGQETSFGKSIEKIVMPQYPIAPGTSWADPVEKIEEFAALAGLGKEARAQARVDSVWREIDASCVDNRGRRHLLTIKSGTQTINDTQVHGMFSAIRQHGREWLRSSRARLGVEGIDIVIGLTYGTDRGTNNKDNQILAKLLTCGFSEVDRIGQPGVLTNADGSIRVYRVVGIDYWAYAANPAEPATAQFAFLEVLLGLAEALRMAHRRGTIREALDSRVAILEADFRRLQEAEEDALPPALRQHLGPQELSWLAASTRLFFDS